MAHPELVISDLSLLCQDEMRGCIGYPTYRTPQGKGISDPLETRVEQYTERITELLVYL